MQLLPVGGEGGRKRKKERERKRGERRERERKSNPLEYLEELNMKMSFTRKKINFHVFIKWLPQLLKLIF